MKFSNKWMKEDLPKKICNKEVNWKSGHSHVVNPLLNVTVFLDGQIRMLLDLK